MPGQYSDTLAAATAVSYRLPWGMIKGLCWGNPKNIKFVCTHGWLDNAHSFLPLAQHYLNNSTLRHQGGMLALDWAGHGLSDHRPAGTHYHFIDYAYDLWSLLEQQKWRDIVLLGHSMGGFVSNITASLCADRLSHLVLIEAFGLLVSDGEDAHRQLNEGFISRQKLTNSKWRDYGELSSAVEARLKSADFSKPLVEILVQRGCFRNPQGRWQWRADPRVKATSPYRLPASTVEQILKQIDTPVTLIRGEQGYDKVAPAVSRWGHCVDQLSVQVVAGGHHVHMENPQQIARLLAAIDATV